MRFTSQKYLMYTIFLLLGMIAFDAPLWISLFSFVLISYKILTEKKNLKIMSRKLTTSLSILLLVLIYVQFRSFLGQEASTTLLMGLTALKIVEYENQRDHKYLVILGFMLLSMKPLFSLDLYWAPLLLISFIGLWLSMLSPSQKNPFQFLTRLFVLSIPLAVVLFFVFPRVILPWAKKNTRQQSSTGFSEILMPGSTSELVQTNILVFRTKFYDFKPKPIDLYWRGSVLNLSEGLTWKITGDRYARENFNLTQDERTKRVKYDVYLEPGNLNYIFALETPLNIKGEGFFVRSFEGGIFRANTNLEKTFLYRGVSSFYSNSLDKPTPLDLQIPALSPKVNEFLSPHQGKTANQKINFLNNFFMRSEFEYTLQPGTYGDNELEEFLFERKKGFCEHFAGSYATLVRAMGIPARVIVGFQGGSYNTFGEFWKVSTKDAHAWVEVYLNDQWQRIDPTALVTPMRIELGADQFFDNSQIALRSNAQKNLKLIFDQLISMIENINYSWMSFLIEFDKEYQKNLLFKMRDNLGWILLGFISILFLVKIVSVWLLNRENDINEFQKLFHDIFSYGEKLGIKRDPSDSPERYLNKLSSFVSKKEFESLSQEIIQNYTLTFYSDKESQDTSVALTLNKKWKKLKASLKDSN